jgi:hypothetical protein
MSENIVTEKKSDAFKSLTLRLIDGHRKTELYRQLSAAKRTAKIGFISDVLCGKNDCLFSDMGTIQNDHFNEFLVAFEDSAAGSIDHALIDADVLEDNDDAVLFERDTECWEVWRVDGVHVLSGHTQFGAFGIAQLSVKTDVFG